jgi:hypothetical protein
MRAFLVASLFVLAVVSTGCGSSGGGVSTVPSAADGNARTISANGGGGVAGGGGGGGAAGSGGGGGGATCPAIATAPGTVPFPQIPPAQVTDAPCWFFYFPAEPAANVTRPLAINFGAQQNTVQGAIPIGGHSISTFYVYNTSKKSVLTFSSLSIAGPNAGDFQLEPGLVATAMNGVPVRNPSLIALQVTFTPSAEGARTATLQLVSNAGTQLIALNGAGLPNRPIIAGIGGSLHFIDAPPVVSAPDLMQIANVGGQTLVIQSASFGGANPSSFALFARNGFTTQDPANFAGLEIGPHAMTPQFQIGLSPTAQPGDTATFVVNSNDPLQPSVTTQLSVSTTL